MGHPVEITTPIPSIEETAKAVGVSPSRARELVRLAQSVLRVRNSRSKRLQPGKGEQPSVPDQEPTNRDPKRPNLPNAFLNIPYDDRFEGLYLAYIAGITAYGLAPRAPLEVPGGERRLDRIFDLIRSCQYSFHDLSRVEIDPRRPATPRFNMPFELGPVLRGISCTHESTLGLCLKPRSAAC